MQYIIRGANGKEYGPVDLVTLIEWVKQGRVNPDTKIRNMGNGMLLMASNMPELDGMFQVNQSKVATAISSGYLYAQPAAVTGQADHWEDYKFVVLMSVLGMAFSPIFCWFAIGFNIMGMKRAWEAAREQKPMAGLGFSIALLSMLATIAIPFLMQSWLQSVVLPHEKTHAKAARGIDDK